MWASLHEQGAGPVKSGTGANPGEVYPEWLSITAIRKCRGAIHRFIGIFTDMTSRKGKERAIYQLANYDSLIAAQSPPVQQRARLALAAELAHGGSADAVCRSGWLQAGQRHHPGPHAAMRLVAMARRLATWTTTPRWPGWKATIFDSGPPSVGRQSHMAPAGRTSAGCRAPCTVDGAASNVHLSASIGVSCFPYDADTVEIAGPAGRISHTGGQGAGRR